VPAGGDEPDREINPKFGHKLDFLDEMRAAKGLRPAPKQRAILVGDLNVAPLENDVWSHKQLLDVVSHTPVETGLLNAARDTFDWIDVTRSVVPAEEKIYSWWSYRAQDWKKSDRGRRLDHIWVTPALVPRLKGAKVKKPARGWPQGSDHVPVIVEFGD